MERSEQCATCKGSGCQPGTTPEICPDCRGSGQVQVQQRTPMGVFATSRPCQKCHGTGRIIHQPCTDCGGQGRVRKRKTIKVNIPAGIDHGQTISLRGQGNAGKNGGRAGDLLITVMVQPDETVPPGGRGRVLRRAHHLRPGGAGRRRWRSPPLTAR